MTQTNDPFGDFESVLISAGSNPEYVGQLMAEFVRSLMGASVAVQASSGISSANRIFLEIMKRIPGMNSEDMLACVQAAEVALRVEDRNDLRLIAAQAGTRHLLACSTTDAFSEARKSSTGSRFLDTMRLALGLKE